MLAAIHLIVKDGEKYVRKCLEAALSQNFNDCEVLVFDNNSSDKTVSLSRTVLDSDKVVKFDRNYGLGGGFNRSLQYSDSKYIVLLCVDVILDPNFLSEAMKVLESDPRIGALQPKVLQWDFKNDTSTSLSTSKLTDIIDTTGFQIFKSRRIINRGHGEKDIGQHQEGEIFSYEGACPVFRREALDNIKICKRGQFLRKPSRRPSGHGVPNEVRDERGRERNKIFLGGENYCVFSKELPELLDEDFGWYADDVDLGWRLRLFGWKSYFSPKVIAWHDRQTTKRLRKNFTPLENFASSRYNNGGAINILRKGRATIGSFLMGLIDFIKIRRQVPWRKRMLDWRNQRLTMIKNEIPNHFLKDLPHFLKREIPLLIYFFFFEPRTFWLGVFGFFKLLPTMLKKRKYIMSSRKVGANEIGKWFI